MCATRSFGSQKTKKKTFPSYIYDGKFYSEVKVVRGSELQPILDV